MRTFLRWTFTYPYTLLAYLFGTYQALTIIF